MKNSKKRKRFFDNLGIVLRDFGSLFLLFLKIYQSYIVLGDFGGLLE